MVLYASITSPPVPTDWLSPIPGIEYFIPQDDGLNGWTTDSRGNNFLNGMGPSVS